MSNTKHNQGTYICKRTSSWHTIHLVITNENIQIYGSRRAKPSAKITTESTRRQRSIEGDIYIYIVGLQHIFVDVFNECISLPHSRLDTSVRSIDGCCWCMSAEVRCVFIFPSTVYYWRVVHVVRNPSAYIEVSNTQQGEPSRCGCGSYA